MPPSGNRASAARGCKKGGETNAGVLRPASEGAMSCGPLRPFKKTVCGSITSSTLRTRTKQMPAPAKTLRSSRASHRTACSPDAASLRSTCGLPLRRPPGRGCRRRGLKPDASDGVPRVEASHGASPGPPIADAAGRHGKHATRSKGSAPRTTRTAARGTRLLDRARKLISILT